MANAQNYNRKTSVSTGDNPGPSDMRCHSRGAKGAVGSRDIPTTLSARAFLY